MNCLFILIILEQWNNEKNASRHHIAMQFMNYPISQTIAISVHLQSHQDQISIDNQVMEARLENVANILDFFPDFKFPAVTSGLTPLAAAWIVASRCFARTSP